MTVSDWERKRTLDAMFQHVPAHQRSEFLERVKKEQDKMDKENGKKDTVSVKAPKKPAFLKKDEKGKVPPQFLSKQKKKGDKVDEVVTGQLGMVTPRPMQVDVLPGTEVRDTQSFSATTSMGGEDQHTHVAFFDSAGNGYTSPDDTGHTHEVRSFMVSDYQRPDGESYHDHPGPLPRPETTPGAEYMDYTGIM